MPPCSEAVGGIVAWA